MHLSVILIIFYYLVQKGLISVEVELNWDINNNWSVP